MKRLMNSWHHYEVIPAPFDLQGELFCICVVMEVTLILRMRNGLFSSHLGRLSSLLQYHPAFIEFLLLWIFGPERRNCSAWCHLRSPGLSSSVSAKVLRNQKRWCCSSSLRAAGSSPKKSSYFTLDLQKEKDWCASSNAVRKNSLICGRVSLKTNHLKN